MPADVAAARTPVCHEEQSLSGWLRLLIAVAAPFVLTTLLLAVPVALVRYYQNKRVRSLEAHVRGLKARAAWGTAGATLRAELAASVARSRANRELLVQAAARARLEKMQADASEAEARALEAELQVKAREEAFESKARWQQDEQSAALARLEKAQIDAAHAERRARDAELKMRAREDAMMARRGEAHAEGAASAWGELTPASPPTKVAAARRTDRADDKKMPIAPPAAAKPTATAQRGRQGAIDSDAPTAAPHATNSPAAAATPKAEDCSTLPDTTKESPGKLLGRKVLSMVIAQHWVPRLSARQRPSAARLTEASCSRESCSRESCSREIEEFLNMKTGDDDDDSTIDDSTAGARNTVDELVAVQVDEDAAVDEGAATAYERHTLSA